MTATAVANPMLVRALLAGPESAVLAELASATLLVPVAPVGGGDGLVRRGRTLGGRALVWAFTDEEAVRAWDRHPAHAIAPLPSSELSGLEAVVAVNAAGPGACLVEPASLALGPSDPPPALRADRLRAARGPGRAPPPRPSRP